jgi:hypothetical protein
MKKTFLLAGIALLLAIACGRSERAAEQKAVIADVEMSPQMDPPSGSLNEQIPPPPEEEEDFKNKPEVGNAISSSAARQDPNDTTHKFVRTAAMRLRVKNVVQATLGIENIVGAHRGWVTETVLKSEEQGKDHVQVSEDSTLEIARYQVSNEVTLRVPNTELDSTLRQIGRWVDLFEHRTINADDVRLRMMANAMAVRRSKAHAMRIARAINEKGSKLKETTAAEDAILRDEERADQEVLNNLDMKDRIDYSTVTLYLYERQQVRRELIANVKSVDGFRPSLGSRMGHAFASGWRIIENVAVAAVTIWPLLLIAAGVMVIVFRRSRKPSTT